ncbi:GTP-binding protein [Candidatus Woesearchaeota archaeon]|nr:GTP-binding protein [Candidatus Woesearchaeota archaeon]
MQNMQKTEPGRGKNDTASDKIRELEERISSTKYNKKTQHAIGLYKAQLAKLKEKQASRGKGKKGEGYSVRKTGDGTAVLLGFPSVGKSTLLNAITNSESKVGAYAFTTLTVIPGTLEYKHAKIQVLDVPGVVHGAAAGTGRGKEVLAVIRNADLVLIIVDVFNPEHYKALLKEVYDTGVRINQKKPDVKIEKASRGGISIGSTVKLTKLDKKTIESVLREFDLNNANIVLREDIDVDQLIDIVEGNKVYIPSICVLNKIDMVNKEDLDRIKGKINPDLCISADKKINIDELKELIFRRLRLMRIYLKEYNKKADLDEPLIIKEGATLRDLCSKLHKDFVSKFKFAKVWGKSAKYPGMKITKIDHAMEDEDIIELRIK